MVKVLFENSLSQMVCYRGGWKKHLARGFGIQEIHYRVVQKKYYWRQ